MMEVTGFEETDNNNEDNNTEGQYVEVELSPFIVRVDGYSWQQTKTSYARRQPGCGLVSFFLRRGEDSLS